MSLGGSLEKGFNVDGGTDGIPIGNISDALKTADICNAGGVAAALTVGTSAVLACAGGAAANLTNRKVLTIHNNALVAIYWGTSNTVTTSTGSPIAPGQTVILAVGASTSIYLITSLASQNTRVTEMA